MCFFAVEVEIGRVAELWQYVCMCQKPVEVLNCQSAELCRKFFQRGVRIFPVELEIGSVAELWQYVCMCQKSRNRAEGRGALQ